MTIAAVTLMDGQFPAYVNVSEDGDEVVVTVRANPTVREGIYICGYHPRDSNAYGRCTPGNEHCNNYCNSAPDRGPMQDSPKSLTRVECGESSSARMPKAAWEELKRQIVG